MIMIKIASFWDDYNSDFHAQFLVQRSMSTKNFTQTKAGTVLASYLKVLPLLLMIYPGMISRALWPGVYICNSGYTS